MNWILKFFTSSIGQKLIMSLTGLFLITFLPVHLAGNVQLLFSDGGEAFNKYAYFMTNNSFIKFTSYGLYAFILLHMLQGIVIWLTNKSAKGSKYAVSNVQTSFASRNMGPLGMILLVFLVVHMGQFWFKMKVGWLANIQYEGYDHAVKNLYTPVEAAFTNPLFVIFYVACMVAIGLHLSHGFQSAFQTLGLNHKKYTPIIKGLGLAYSIIIPLGFAAIPVIFFIKNMMG